MSRRQPAGQTAVDNGADAVYIGLKDDTNARASPASTSPRKAAEAVDYVHRHGRKLHIAINTFAHPAATPAGSARGYGGPAGRRRALILADLAMLEYAAQRYPQLERHVSVQASATNEEAIRFYQRNFEVGRVVLPRVLSMHQVNSWRAPARCRWKCSPSAACASWPRGAAISLPT